MSTNFDWNNVEASHIKAKYLKKHKKYFFTF